MSATSTTRSWENKRTDETRMVEKHLGAAFEQVDAYRYNSASIRVRVIDSRFETLNRDQRDSLVEVELDKLPPATQSDIVTLLTLAPSELTKAPETFRDYLQNLEFDDPTPSVL